MSKKEEKEKEEEKRKRIVPKGANLRVMTILDLGLSTALVTEREREKKRARVYTLTHPLTRLQIDKVNPFGHKLAIHLACTFLRYLYIYIYIPRQILNDRKSSTAYLSN